MSEPTPIEDKCKEITPSKITEYLYGELNRNYIVANKLDVVLKYVTHVEAREKTYKQNITMLVARCLKLEELLKARGIDVPDDD